MRLIMKTNKPTVLICILSSLFFLSLDFTNAQSTSSKLLHFESDTYEISLTKIKVDFSGTASNQRQRKLQGSLQFISNRLEPGTEVITRDRLFIDNTFELEIRAKDSMIDDILRHASNHFFELMELEYAVKFDRNIQHTTKYKLIIIDELLLQEKLSNRISDAGVLSSVTVKDGRVKAEGVTLETVAEILTNNTNANVNFYGNFDSRINFEIDLRKSIEQINDALKQKYGLGIN